MPESGSGIKSLSLLAGVIGVVGVCAVAVFLIGRGPAPAPRAGEEPDVPSRAETQPPEASPEAVPESVPAEEPEARASVAPARNPEAEKVLTEFREVSRMIAEAQLKAMKDTPEIAEAAKKIEGNERVLKRRIGLVPEVVLKGNEYDRLLEEQRVLFRQRDSVREQKAGSGADPGLNEQERGIEARLSSNQQSVARIGRELNDVKRAAVLKHPELKSLSDEIAADKLRLRARIDALPQIVPLRERQRVLGEKLQKEGVSGAVAAPQGS